MNLELGTEYRGPRHGIGGRVEIEHAGRVEEILIQVDEIPGKVVLRGHLAAERADHSRDEQCRFLQMAVAGLIGAAIVVGARLRVEQDRGDYCLHVAAYSLPVV